MHLFYFTLRFTIPTRRELENKPLKAAALLIALPTWQMKMVHKIQHGCQSTHINQPTASCHAILALTLFVSLPDSTGKAYYLPCSWSAMQDTGREIQSTLSGTGSLKPDICNDPSVIYKNLWASKKHYGWELAKDCNIRMIYLSLESSYY